MGISKIERSCENCINYKPNGTDCPKCKNNHWKGESISLVVPCIKTDPQRKEYFECSACGFKWYA